MGTFIKVENDIILFANVVSKVYFWTQKRVIFWYGIFGNLVLMLRKNKVHRRVGNTVYWASLANVKHHILLPGTSYDRCYKCKFMNSRPLCGIDGKTYQNKCMADCKGVVRVNNDYNVFLEVKNVSFKIFFFPIVEN